MDFDIVGCATCGKFFPNLFAGIAHQHDTHGHDPELFAWEFPRPLTEPQGPGNMGHRPALSHS